jgi:hypothetical protein
VLPNPYRSIATTVHACHVGQNLAICQEIQPTQMNSTKYTEVFNISSFPVDLLARFFLYLAKSIKALAVSWQVYKLTKHPLALGYLGLAKSCLAWPLGHYVDQQEKRKVHLSAISGQLLRSLGLAILSVNPAPNKLMKIRSARFD